MIIGRSHLHALHQRRILALSYIHNKGQHLSLLSVKKNSGQLGRAAGSEGLARAIVQSAKKGLMAEQSTDAQAQDAIIWASQHGLVNSVMQLSAQ